MGLGSEFLDLPGVMQTVLSGPLANRPPASYRNAGSVYVATDTGAASYSTGSAWIAVSGGGGGAVASVTASAPLSSSGGATPNITHNTSGVTAGSYAAANITVDADGHVTTASNGSVGSGTVTSVGLSLPSIFTVSGSPITTSGTLTATLASEAANTVFAAPNGSAGVPTFRALVAGADIPIFGPSGASHAAGAVPDPGLTAGTTRFLREDATWGVPSGGAGGVNVQSGGTYTFATSDNGKLVQFTSSVGCTATLPASGLSAGWYCDVQSACGSATGQLELLAASGTQIDGVASGADYLTHLQGCRVFYDGTNFYTMRGLPTNFPGQIIGFLSTRTDEGTTSTTYVDLTTADSLTFNLDSAHDLLVEYLSFTYSPSTPSNNYSEIFLDGVGQSATQFQQTVVTANIGQEHVIIAKLAGVASGMHTIDVKHHADGTHAAHWLNRSLKISILV